MVLRLLQQPWENLSGQKDKGLFQLTHYMVYFRDAVYCRYNYIYTDTGCYINIAFAAD